MNGGCDLNVVLAFCRPESSCFPPKHKKKHEKIIASCLRVAKERPFSAAWRGGSPKQVSRKNVMDSAQDNSFACKTTPRPGSLVIEAPPANTARSTVGSGVQGSGLQGSGFRDQHGAAINLGYFTTGTRICEPLVLYHFGDMS